MTWPPGRLISQGARAREKKRKFTHNWNWKWTWKADGKVVWLEFILRVIRSIVGKILLHTFSCRLTHSVSSSLSLSLSLLVSLPLLQPSADYGPRLLDSIYRCHVKLEFPFQLGERRVVRGGYCRGIWLWQAKTRQDERDKNGNNFKSRCGLLPQQQQQQHNAGKF